MWSLTIVCGASRHAPEQTEPAYIQLCKSFDRQDKPSWCFDALMLWCFDSDGIPCGCATDFSQLIWGHAFFDSASGWECDSIGAQQVRAVRKAD